MTACFVYVTAPDADAARRIVVGSRVISALI